MEHLFFESPNLERLIRTIRSFPADFSASQKDTIESQMRVEFGRHVVMFNAHYNPDNDSCYFYFLGPYNAIIDILSTHNDSRSLIDRTRICGWVFCPPDMRSENVQDAFLFRVLSSDALLPNARVHMMLMQHVNDPEHSKPGNRCTLTLTYPAVYQKSINDPTSMVPKRPLQPQETLLCKYFQDIKTKQDKARLKYYEDNMHLYLTEPSGIRTAHLEKLQTPIRVRAAKETNQFTSRTVVFPCSKNHPAVFVLTVNTHINKKNIESITYHCKASIFTQYAPAATFLYPKPKAITVDQMEEVQKAIAAAESMDYDDDDTIIVETFSDANK